MNSRERMALALQHREPDRVPAAPILSGVTRHLVGASYPQWSTDAAVCAEALARGVRRYGADCVVTLIDLSVECDAWGQKIVYPENEAAHPDYSHPIVAEAEDYAKVEKRDYRQSKRMMMHLEVCKRLVEDVGGEIPVIAFVFGPLGTLSMLRGQEKLYLDLYDDPDAVKKAAGNVKETLMDYCGALLGTGVDGIMFDTLFSSGSIMSKGMWQEMEAPLVKELAEFVHGRDKLVMIHNCGQKIYFDAQIEAMRPDAISFLYPPDDCADFKECKEKYGDKVTLIGCVPPTLAVTGTKEEWEEACREQIGLMAKDGGFVLATGCEYPSNASFDRAKEMVEIACRFGRYEG